MGELRHRERELPLRRRGDPDRVGELRESRPGEPGAAALSLSVRQAELVGHGAMARHRSGRRQRGHPRLRRACLQDPGASLLRECGDRSAYGSSNVRIFDPETCYATAGLPPGTTPGWWPQTLFGIGTGALLVAVVSAIALILILAVWRSRRRRSEGDDREETPAGPPKDRRG